jgi:hypothetical protein
LYKVPQRMGAEVSRREIFVTARLSAAERAQVDRAAKALGLTRSALVRQLLLDAAAGRLRPANPAEAPVEMAP